MQKKKIIPTENNAIRPADITSWFVTGVGSFNVVLLVVSASDEDDAIGISVEYSDRDDQEPVTGCVVDRCLSSPVVKVVLDLCVSFSTPELLDVVNFVMKVLVLNVFSDVVGDFASELSALVVNGADVFGRSPNCEKVLFFIWLEVFVNPSIVSVTGVLLGLLERDSNVIAVDIMLGDSVCEMGELVTALLIIWEEMETFLDVDPEKVEDPDCVIDLAVVGIKLVVSP